MQQFRLVEAQMPIASKAQMPILSKGSIAGHLVQAAQARAWLLGLHFHKDVDSRMAGLAEQGAVVILKAAKDKKEETKERYVRGATRVGSEAMVVFVDEMAITRLTVADYVQKPGTELRDDVWTKVRDVLCPLWPICCVHIMTAKTNITGATPQGIEGLKAANTLTAQVITVAAGLLAFTVTFAEKFTPAGKQIALPTALKVSWLCFAATLSLGF